MRWARLLLLAVAAALPRQAPAQEGVPPRVEIFVRPGCPHCAAAKDFLERLQRERPALRVVVLDVTRDSAALARLLRLTEAHGVSVPGVPAILVGGQLQIGFDSDETTGALIERWLDPPAGAPPEPPDAIATPVGRLSASGMGLPLFTVAVGLLDGFNPCAMWALLYVLALLVNLRSRRRMALIGGTFILVGGVLYFAFMAAWLELFRLVGLSRAVQASLGALAIVIGGINLKDAVVFKRGVSLTIPDSAKPGLYAQMRRVLTAEHLAGAVIAVAVLSALVNLVELLCTAGLPAVYTSILSARELPRPAHYGYLGLYVAAYLLDDSIMLAVAVVTLSRARLQERGGRVLKLISGAVMLALGVLLLARPSLLL